MINKIASPLATPTSLGDYTAQNSLILTLALVFQNTIKVVASNVLKGAVFFVGGSIYLADADTAISGSASDFVKLTPSEDGLTLAATFVANLTGVTWSSTYNGYYDVDGNLYEFDELKAFSGALIANLSYKSVESKGISLGWAKALISPGAGWVEELISTRGYTSCGLTQNIIASAIADASSVVTSYTKVKEITIDRAGTINVYFNLRNGYTTGSYTAHARIYLDYVPIGTDRSNYDKSTGVVYGETITVTKGAKIQIWSKSDSGVPAIVSAMKLCAIPSGIVINMD